jgi:hypothetical protein
MMMRYQRLVTVASGLSAMAIGFAPQVANACATCGLDLDGQAGHAFKTSVLFMISAPYITFMVIGTVMYRAWRKAHPRPEAAGIGLYRTLHGLASKFVTGSIEGRRETL